MQIQCVCLQKLKATQKLWLPSSPPKREEVIFGRPSHYEAEKLGFVFAGVLSFSQIPAYSPLVTKMREHSWLIQTQLSLSRASKMPFPQLENAKGQLWLQLHFAWANAVTIVIRPVHRGDIFWHRRHWCIPRNPPSLLPFPFGKHSDSSGPSSSTSFTLQVGKTSAFILHTATAVPYFSCRSQAGVCF